VRWVALVPLLSALGCGSNKATAPSTTPTTLTGNWTYSAGSLTSIAGGYTCVVASFTLSLVQEGNALSGSYQSGSITCNGTALPGASGAIANGSVSGNTVTFDFDSPDWHDEGNTTSATSMSGDVNATLTIAGTLYLLAGTWTAVRK
jgi:hypothetical protein